MVISISYHDTVAKLQGFVPFVPGPFDRAEWYDALARATPDALVVIADDGQQRAVLPLRQDGSTLRALTNWFSFTWRPLVPADVAGDALLLAMASALRGRAAVMDFSSLPDEEGSATRLATALRKAGWLVDRSVCDENHFLELEGRSFAEYWATRKGALRTVLKRKQAKVAVEITTVFQDEVWEIYRSVYADSWKPAEEQANFLENFAREEGTAGRLRIGIGYSNGEPVAAQFWTVENGIAYIHKLAHREAAKPLSAGTIVTAALFRHTIDIDRVHQIDFGTGRDAYKRDWMENVRPRYRLIAHDPRNVRAWPGLLKTTVRRLARLIPRG